MGGYGQLRGEWVNGWLQNSPFQKMFKQQLVRVQFPLFYQAEFVVPLLIIILEVELDVFGL